MNRSYVRGDTKSAKICEQLYFICLQVYLECHFVLHLAFLKRKALQQFALISHHKGAYYLLQEISFDGNKTIAFLA